MTTWPRRFNLTRVAAHAVAAQPSHLIRWSRWHDVLLPLAGWFFAKRFR